MDTVPEGEIDRWTTEPFDPAVRNGFLYARGACDMKAGLAAQIGVAYALSGRLGGLAGRLILHFAVGEECGEPGTLSLCDAGFVGDVGIVTEPTGLRISVATRGLLPLRIRVLGRAGHASMPDSASNPVDHLPAVLAEVEAYGRELGSRQHPLLGSGSCTATMIQAGVKVNAIADHCDVHLDRRLIPGEAVDEELTALDTRLGALRESRPGFQYELSSGDYVFEPAEVRKDASIATALRKAGAAVLGAPPPVVGTPFASDVRNLVNDAGMEAVTFGPGDVSECHCPDERVELEQVDACARVLTQVVLDLMS